MFTLILIYQKCDFNVCVIFTSNKDFENNKMRNGTDWTWLDWFLNTFGFKCKYFSIDIFFNLRWWSIWSIFLSPNFTETYHSMIVFLMNFTLKIVIKLLGLFRCDMILIWAFYSFVMIWPKLCKQITSLYLYPWAISVMNSWGEH